LEVSGSPVGLDCCAADSGDRTSTPHPARLKAALQSSRRLGILRGAEGGLRSAVPIAGAGRRRARICTSGISLAMVF